MNAVTSAQAIAALSSPVLRLRGIHKHFQLARGPLHVLDDIALDVRPGEFICIVGASGCGKSTLLRLVAGLDRDYAGSIDYEGRAVTGTALERGFIFQEHRLFPWLTVEENIRLAFAATRVPGAEQKQRVAEQIHRVGLDGFEKACLLYTSPSPRD